MRRIALASLIVATIVLIGGAMTMLCAQNAAPTNYVIPLIQFDDVPLADAIRNLSRQLNFSYILDPRVPGSGLGPGRWLRQPMINVRWENITPQQAFDRLLTSNNLIRIKIPTTDVTRIAPANPASRLAPDNLRSSDTKRITSEAFEDWDLIVTLRTLGKHAGIKLWFDRSLSAPALGLWGDAPGWSGSDQTTSRQAITVLLDTYDLLMIEDPATSSARITLNTHAKTNSLNTSFFPSQAKDGCRTVDVGFRLTIPSNWQKEKVYPIDSNCGTYSGDTACLEFDEKYIGYTAAKAQAVIADLKSKESQPKLLKPGEEIWHVDGRIADFIIGRSELKRYAQQGFLNVAELFVPYPGQPGCLSVFIYYQSDQDLPTARRVLQSIQWKKTQDGAH